jgi:hypothetical protein
MGIDSPIDINSNITDQCSGLCALNFNFQDSKCVVSKIGADVLGVMAYDPSTDSKYIKTFKGVKYEVSNIYIYNNSLHLYNGKRTDAELLISFEGTGGDGAGKVMVICIPIEQKSSSGAETKIDGSIITSIIMAIDSSKTGIRTATSSDNAAVKFASGDTYNLNNVVPSQQPFYTYIGNAPYQSSGPLINYVVFPRSSSIYVPTSAIERLNKITTPSKSPISGVPQNSPTYNSAGANASEDSDVYIECSPAGSDGVQLYQASSASGADGVAGVAGDSAKSNSSFTNFIESDMFVVGIQIILFGFVAILTVFLANKFIRGFSSVSSDDPGSSSSINIGKSNSKKK